MPRWTSDDLRAYEDRVARLRAPQPEQPPGKALVRPISGEAEGGAGTPDRFSVRFDIFAVRPLDFDNAFTKPLQDCLVAAGIIPGDDWKTLEGHVACHKAGSKSEERTEVTIERLE